MKHYYSLFSGGFDSTLATLKVIRENEPLKLTPVFFNYGQKSKEKEAEAVKKLVPVFREFARDANTQIDECRIFKTGHLFSWSQSAILEGTPTGGDVGLENRNLILISCVASIIIADYKDTTLEDVIEIVTGFTNGYYDTTSAFADRLSELFESMGQKIKVIAPLIPEGQTEEVAYGELAKLAHSLGAISLLKNTTWSCYYPQQGNKPCGQCPPCKKRKEIFDEWGMKLVKRKKR